MAGGSEGARSAEVDEDNGANLALHAIEIKHGDGAPLELAAPWRESEGLCSHAAGNQQRWKTKPGIYHGQKLFGQSSSRSAGTAASTSRPTRSMGCLNSIVTMLYGELSPTELLQASFFSLLLCFIVGIYWMMRSLKDSIFATIVGLEYQPMAKMLSLVVVTLLLFCYNKIVDCVPRHHLFAVICGSYSAVFVLTAVLLMSTTFGLNGPDGQPLPASPDRLLGWVHYFAIESYGSLVVSLFWQYLNSQVNLKAAKAQYGLITAGGQVGAITGCTLVVGSKRFGVPQLYAFGGVLTLVSPLIVAVYLRYFPPVEQVADTEAGRSGGDSAAKRVQPGLFEGLRLLIRHPYVLGIFGVSALFEIIATILDYQMKVGVGTASATRAHGRGKNGLAPWPPRSLRC